jgi:hypothetical protein
VALVLDSGALIAFERGDRPVAALIEVTRRRRERVVTTSPCVAQAWRGDGGRQAVLARLLQGVNEHALDEIVSRSVGALCAATGRGDVVDAHLALVVRNADVVVTSDVKDIRAHLRERGCTAQVERC